MARNVSLEGPDPIDVGVGLRVREIRRGKKLSQQDLAEACGVTYQQLQKYERGRNRVSASMLIRLSHALDCYAGDLLPPEHGEANQVSPRVMAIVASVSGAEALVRAFARIASEEERDQLFQVAAVIAKRFD